MQDSCGQTIPDALHARAGWPWQPVELPALPSGARWPKISIVTPSFNQVSYIEETIRSVLLQGYPNLEYIIIDGGSTDGSVDIIRHYEHCLAYWVSEPDHGQAHAINKGFARSTGDLMAWINSDDYYAPGALFHMARLFMEQDTGWAAGNCHVMSLDGTLLPGWGEPPHDIERWFMNSLYAQPGIFWRRSLWQQTRGIDESLHYSFDYELWLQFAGRQPFPAWTDAYVATFRLQPTSKTTTNKSAFQRENQQIYRRYRHYLIPVKSRVKIWAIRRNRLARRLINTQNMPVPRLNPLLRAFAQAPWLARDPKYRRQVRRALGNIRRSLLQKHKDKADG